MNKTYIIIGLIGLAVIGYLIYNNFKNNNNNNDNDERTTGTFQAEGSKTRKKNEGGFTPGERNNGGKLQTLGSHSKNYNQFIGI